MASTSDRKVGDRSIPNAIAASARRSVGPDVRALALLGISGAEHDPVGDHDDTHDQGCAQHAEEPGNVTGHGTGRATEMPQARPVECSRIHGGGTVHDGFPAGGHGSPAC